MSENLRYVWIDDDPGRRKVTKALEAANNIKVLFENVRGIDIVAYIKDLLDKMAEPDLILIDHKLDRVRDPSFIATGATAAEIIREKWKDCPIIAVTNVDPKEDIDHHKRVLYDEIIEYSNISKYYGALFSVAKSFRKLKSSRPKNINDVLRLLKVPKNDIDLLTLIAPEDIKRGLTQAGSLTSLFKWVKNNLMGRAGFLYDRLWVATLIGVKINSFVKVEDVFALARYRGIFEDIDNERWWVSKVKEILFSKFPASDEVFPWKLGTKIEGLSEKDRSKCYVCGDYFPEIVAFTDETSSKRESMHLRCTILHPKYESVLYFEDVRMLKSAE